LISFNPVLPLLCPIAASHESRARGYPVKAISNKPHQAFIHNLKPEFVSAQNITGLKNSLRDLWEEGGRQPIKHDDVDVTS